VDFKKAFNTMPRDKIWNKMEELRIPDGYRAPESRSQYQIHDKSFRSKHVFHPIHKLYEKVRAKIRTSEGMSECFGSDIGIKQGFPLSPTLFGLYIDKLEAWLRRTNGEGVHLAGYVMNLLLYTDDLILISKIVHGLREHLKALEHFFIR
jgi:hypothetical protein